MKQKKTKLRLRKQVIICIPIVLLIIVLTIGMFINKDKSYSSEVEKNEEITSEKIITDGKNLSEVKYIKEFNKIIEQRQKDNTIIYYASKFKLNINKTLEIAHNLTNNYENEQYLNTNVIAPVSIANRIGSFNSFEAGVVYFARDLYRYPEKYGSSIAEIRLDETATINDTVNNEIIYMDNGLTFSQYLGKICDLYGVDKSIALAIVYEESGIMTSGLFKYNNNISGMRGYAGWMNFTTLEAGIISHVIGLKAIIDNYSIDMNDPNAVYTLSAIYVHGNPGAGISESWSSKVLHFKEKIEQEDLFTIK